MSLPASSAIAVSMGLVKPIDCPACGGSGEVEDEDAVAQGGETRNL